MKNYKKLISIVLALMVTGLVYGQTGYEKERYNHGGEAREYLKRMPQGEQLRVNGLLVSLHGLGFTMAGHQAVMPFDELADANNWMVVIPQGKPATAVPVATGLPVVNLNLISAWNAGMNFTKNGLEYRLNGAEDDAGFLMGLIDSLAENYGIPSDSIVIAGLSMGGFMAHRMAVEYGERIGAVVAYGGTLANGMEAETPAGPVDVMHVHGTKDELVDYDECTSPLNLFGNVPVGLPAEATVAWWVAANGCDPQAQVSHYGGAVEGGAILHYDGISYDRYDYRPRSEGGGRVSFLKVNGGGHLPPMSEGLFGFDARTLAFTFVRGDRNTPVVGVEKPETNAMQVYPNPAQGRVNIDLPIATTLTLMNAEGRQLWSRSYPAGTATLTLPQGAGLYILTVGERHIKVMNK